MKNKQLMEVLNKLSPDADILISSNFDYKNITEIKQLTGVIKADHGIKLVDDKDKILIFLE